MDFWELIEKRQSTRSFLDKKIEKEKLLKVLEAANKSPSACNFQSYKIYSIEDQKTRFDVQKTSIYNQGFIAQAPVVLVFVTSLKDNKGLGERSEFYAQIDTTIACYQAWLAAVDLGLSGVWVGAFGEEKLTKVLKLKKDEKPVVILPLGYAAENPPRTKRKTLQELVVKI